MSFAASLQAALAHPEAGKWLRRGQQLESRDDPASIEEAVRAYDHAIALFQGTDARLRRGRSIAWMNRANALQRLNSAHAAADAVRSYEQAILGLDGELSESHVESGLGGPATGVEPLRFENGRATRASQIEGASPRYEGTRPDLDRLAHRDPLFLSSLGAAWMNRGVALQQNRSEQALVAAIESHEHAISLLERLPMGRDLAFRRNLAAAWLNLADAMLDTASPNRHERAAAAAKQSIINAYATSATNFSFVEIDLKARRALVVALGEQLFALQGARNESTVALASEASDAIDDGLKLARQWGPHGGDILQALRFRLFCLGCQYYRMYQPHFLGEFIQEVLGNEPALLTIEQYRSVSQHALSAAEEDMSSLRRWETGDPAAMKRLETVQSLREVAQWLASTAAGGVPPSV